MMYEFDPDQRTRLLWACHHAFDPTVQAAKLCESPYAPTIAWALADAYGLGHNHGAREVQLKLDASNFRLRVAEDIIQGAGLLPTLEARVNHEHNLGAWRFDVPKRNKCNVLGCVAEQDWDGACELHRDYDSASGGP